ncbi:phage gateway protein [Fimbriiglobus ruber]|uniref:Phage protein n=1 Tax=Fimbriiglobus ruber TaxID=1908690 RepID=A0A225E0J2_9BACT|nr:hypothetical protein [Fimbriiglobus ruber]OWK42195.1 Phage protein [Fimbriiglobus ruber]
MLDNALIALVISAILAGESAAGLPDTPVKQAFQPTAQGVNTQPTAYLYKLYDHRVGFVARSDVWDKAGGFMVHTETQQYTTTFQISALATQDPKTPTQYTASDILNLIASILQSGVTIATLEAQDVGILHIDEVRNPYFLDDHQRNEAAPSLDFTLTHKQVITTRSPAIGEYQFRIIEV